MEYLQFIHQFPSVSISFHQFKISQRQGLNIAMLVLGEELRLQRVHLHHCWNDCHDPATLALLAVLLGRQHLCVSAEHDAHDRRVDMLNEVGMADGETKRKRRLNSYSVRVPQKMRNSVSTW